MHRLSIYSRAIYRSQAELLRHKLPLLRQNWFHCFKSKNSGVPSPPPSASCGAEVIAVSLRRFFDGEIKRPICEKKIASEFITKVRSRVRSVHPARMNRRPSKRRDNNIVVVVHECPSFASLVSITISHYQRVPKFFRCSLLSILQDTAATKRPVAEFFRFQVPSAHRNYMLTNVYDDFIPMRSHSFGMLITLLMVGRNKINAEDLAMRDFKFTTRSSEFRNWLLSTALTSLLTGVIFVAPAQAQNRSPFNASPIFYDSAERDDPVSHLQSELKLGNRKLEFDQQHGYLTDVLKQLDIPISSQVLVFSRTSFQRPLISRQKPRAVYFNDDVYVGWVQQGDVIELSAVDSQLGANFYTIEQKLSERPELNRRIESCMMCHSSSGGMRVPGHLVRSIHPNGHGTPIVGSGSYRTKHSSPFSKRWGGWYVTGTHGEQKHMGNHFFKTKFDIQNPIPDAAQNVTDLAKLFDTSPYLSEESDIVALMVLEHQVHMHNLLTAACHETKRAIADEERALAKLKKSNKPSELDQNNAPGEQEKIGYSPVTEVRISDAAEQVVEYMLFADETKLTASVKGTSAFENEFAKRGPWDEQKRSLRDFNLKTRMFQHPCSYLIYSQAFKQLPKPVKTTIVDRLNEILSGKDQSRTFQHLSKDDRTAILEILRATHESFSEPK